MKTRINKYISANSVYSRREVDTLIKQGRVLVNGKLAKLGMDVEFPYDTVIVDEERISEKQSYTYMLLNKPIGYITTRKDEKHRPTVMDLIPKKYADLKPAGRLDFNTSGLVILTDDGEFINILTHPKNGVEKVYIAKIFGRLAEQDVKKCLRGIVMEREKYKLDDVREIYYYPNINKSKIEIKISHGKNHEIRNIMKAIGHPVVELKRVSIGNLAIGSIRSGGFTTFSKQEFRKKNEK